LRPTKLLLVLLLLFIDSGRNSQLRAEPPLKAESNVPCVSKAPSHYGVMSWEKDNQRDQPKDGEECQGADHGGFLPPRCAQRAGAFVHLFDYG
jgi:hypothetical protein